MLKTKPRGNYFVFMLFCLVIFMAGCGGGGGSDNSVIGTNNSPVIDSIDIVPGTTVSPSAKVKITCNAADADNDTLTYNWTATNGAVSGTDAQVEWTAPSALGAYTITVSVFDGKTSTTQSSTIQIAEISEELKSIQEEIINQDANWAAGENDITALSEEERNGLLGGVTETPDLKQRVTPKFASSLPSAFDWRTKDGKDWTTPIKHQESCGSCTAFASVGVAEAMKKISENNPSLSIDLSESHLFSCGGRKCSEGMYTSQAADFFKDTGVVDEPCLPYQPVDDLCPNTCSDSQNRLTKIKGWRWVSTDQTSIKSYLLQGPLLVTMAVYKDFFSYQSGVYKHVSGGLKGYHAVAIVGYDDNGKYWIVKNSWGTSWGEKGWFKIAYGESEIEQYIITMSMTYQSPTTSISSPEANSTFFTGQEITFTGQAADPEDGNLSGGSLVWKSNIDGKIGTGTSFAESNLSAGTHTITLTATDSDGAKGAGRVTIIVQLNSSPSISNVTASPSTVVTGAKSTLTCSASDPDGDTLTYSWTGGGGTISGSGSSVSWTAPSTEGTYTPKCEVSDGKGGTASKTVSISVIKNEGSATVTW